MVGVPSFILLYVHKLVQTLLGNVVNCVLKPVIGKIFSKKKHPNPKTIKKNHFKITHNHVKALGKFC